MALRDLLAPAIAALAVIALTAADALPAVHGAPILLFVTLAAVQSGREIATALARREVYLSSAVVGLLIAIVMVHAGYFRPDGGSNTLLLAGTILIAVFALVVVAAAQADLALHGFRAAARHAALGVIVSAVIGGGYGAALLAQNHAVWQGSPAANRFLAALLAAVWLGAGAARLVSLLDPRRAEPDAADETEEADRARPTRAGDLVRVLVTTVALWIGVRIACAGAVGGVLVIGITAGVAAAIGERLIDHLARYCDVESFRTALPRQIAWLGGPYRRAFRGGVIDYAGSLVLVLPVVYGILAGGAR